MSAAGSSTGWTRVAEASAQVPRQVQIVQRSAFSIGAIVIHVGAGGKRAKDRSRDLGGRLAAGSPDGRIRAVVARALAPPPTPRPLTRAEYDRMGDLHFFRGERVELVRGTVVRKSPIGPSHASVVDRLVELLVPPLVGRARVRVQQPFAASDESEPEPDIAVVPSGSYSERHPDRAMLIIEVAESSLEYDRETKGPLYAACGVAEYWIVDVGDRVIDVCTEPSGGRYASVRRARAGERF